MKISDYPADKWHAHKPETWPFQMAKLRQPTEFRKWNGHGANPEFTVYWLPPGTPVKIVMVSRFGDVGITENLQAQNGYGARLCLSLLEPAPVTLPAIKQKHPITAHPGDAA